MALRNLVTALLITCLFSRPAAAGDVAMETLLQTSTSWDGAAYKNYPAGQPEISIVKVTIPPHTKMQWHTHPMPNAGYLLSGELTVERQDGSAKHHYTAGQAIAETVGTVHRGVTGDSPAVIIVFYAGTKGMPLSQPVKGE